MIQMAFLSSGNERIRQHADIRMLPFFCLFAIEEGYPERVFCEYTEF